MFNLCLVEVKTVLSREAGSVGGNPVVGHTGVDDLAWPDHSNDMSVIDSSN